MKRQVQVAATVTFNFEVDDEIASNHDGVTIMTVLERPDREEFYTPEATLGLLLGGLGRELCLEGRPIDRIDGWADFPAAAAEGSPCSVDFQIDEVVVDGTVTP